MVQDRASWIKSIKGKPSNNTGIPRSESAKAKFRLTVSKIEGFGKWNLGKPVSEETKKKISLTMKGRMPTNLSSLHTMFYTDERKRKVSIGRKGKLHTDETKRKISDSKRNPLTPLNKAIRECYKYTNWRIAVFIRDGRRCVLCGSGRTLNADHFPKRFVDIIRECNIQTMDDALSSEELWNIKNGRTLCFECHCKTDNFGNRNNKKH